ncbi:Acetolactate synthase large subunit [Jeotgalicoccus saudimassiliensis]|uniref:Acetolactate synthase n=1 Tax=Jeotgalicoccus saudimassiliensis TaxID=1461582 RepID=A0A078M3N4_9STAP|nr:biosynthetic-type acetolactate synthase large subunit [Jeotgalicoccus saudimassiliensis]CDZ99331.1 Acetolactate synthase large subunit [Jeotgalicoccus saudimassiliensis]
MKVEVEHSQEVIANIKTGADLLVEALAEQEVDTVFGYPGGAVLPIYDALYRHESSFKHILCRHEQGLIHAAEGYARVSSKPGVVIATSGPGATNLITGITDAMMDSLPIVAFTGQVSTKVIGTDAFQEADIIGLTTPITKHNYQVTDVKDLKRIVKEAFHIASTGRPGPVVVDIPKNISEAVVEEAADDAIHLPGYQPTTKPNPLQISRLLEALQKAERPVVLTGAGVQFAKASEELRQFVKQYDLPVVSTLLGLGTFNADDKNFLGMAGMHGTYAANMAIHESDLLINIGARFDDRLTGRIADFAPHARVAHIDIDPAEIGKNVETQIPVVADAKEALEMLNSGKCEMKVIDSWRHKTQADKQQNPLWYDRSEDLISPQWFIEQVYDATAGEAIVTTDVGQHQMWSAQFYHFNQPNHFVTSGGLGTMGFGLPAAIGAQLAFPEKTVVAVVGDGGFQMTMQELATLKQYNLPVKVVIVNNEALGMVRQWQEKFYDERYSESLMQTNPDFVKLGESFGVKSYRFTEEDKVSEELREAMTSDEPVLIDARVVKLDLVYPMVPAGKGNHEMIGVRQCSE